MESLGHAESDIAVMNVTHIDPQRPVATQYAKHIHDQQQTYTASRPQAWQLLELEHGMRVTPCAKNNIVFG